MHPCLLRFPEFRSGSALMVAMDDDLPNLTREELIAEVIRLRVGIRAHRDSSGHDLCWHHPQLWSLLPEPIPERPRRS